MPESSYEDPNLSSNGLTYESGEQLTSGQSFYDIRKYNIDNLEKEYNYYYPRCLDAYKKWKNAQVNNTGERSSLQSKYEVCNNKLQILKNKLEEANRVTEEQLEVINEKTNIQDRNIFINQKRINSSSNVLKEKQERLETDNIKINDYNQLNNSMATKNIIWLILLIIFLIGAVLISFLYFSSGEEGGSAENAEE